MSRQAPPTPRPCGRRRVLIARCRVLAGPQLLPRHEDEGRRGRAGPTGSRTTAGRGPWPTLTKMERPPSPWGRAAELPHLRSLLPPLPGESCVPPTEACPEDPGAGEGADWTQRAPPGHRLGGRRAAPPTTAAVTAHALWGRCGDAPAQLCGHSVAPAVAAAVGVPPPRADPCAF